MQQERVDLERVDSRAFLSDNRIDFQTQGKNISKSGEWIGLCCPFCGDLNYHFGLNVNSNFGSCFRCGKRANLISLVMAISGQNFQNVLRSLRSYENLFRVGRHPRTRDRSNFAKLDKLRDFFESVQKPLSPQEVEYLRNRRIGRDLIQKHKICSGGFIGRFKLRVLIPYFQNHRLVQFTGRDWTGEQEPRYKDCPISVAGNETSHFLFNIDNANGHVCALVEGSMDAIRGGDGFVAISGLSISQHQITVLSNYSLVYIILDNQPKAQAVANNIAATLSNFVNVRIVRLLNDKDVADMPDKDLISLRKSLFG